MILPLHNFFSQPFVIFNHNVQWAFLMMNNHMILFANEMSILQTLKDCNYIGIHKSIQKQPKKNYHCGSIPNSRNKSITAIQLRNTHHQTTIKSFISPLQKDSDSESLGYSTALMTALEDPEASLGDSAEVIGDSAAALEGTLALGTMGDSGVF